MSYLKTSVLALVAAGLVAPAQASTTPTDEQLGEFRATIGQYVQSLQSELRAAMKAGGPVKAIEVCHTQSPLIADATEEQTGIEIYRTSLKPRATPPQDWQADILQWFETRKDEGADVKQLEWFTVSEQGDEQTLHYMKPIPTAGVCLNCHGEHIEPTVISKLDALYPDDQARGFKEGDIRGAFVLQAPLAQ